MSNSKLTCINIRGNLADLAPSNVPITHEFARACLGKPILDENDLQIGVIDTVVVDKGWWYGRIVIDATLKDIIYDEYRQSMSMEVRDV